MLNTDVSILQNIKIGSTVTVYKSSSSHDYDTFIGRVIGITLNYHCVNNKQDGDDMVVCKHCPGLLNVGDSGCGTVGIVYGDQRYECFGRSPDKTLVVMVENEFFKKDDFEI